ncbi:MAG: hypothetical protein OES12_00100 [Anaerolineae bacterium]|nr:hypothetical protein [Anaerolineae bacterium]
MWEWVADWYDGKYYTNSPTRNPQGSKDGRFRVTGGWGLAPRS